MFNFSLHRFVLMMIWISEEHERTGVLIAAEGDRQITNPDKQRIIGMFEECQAVCAALLAERALSRLGRIFGKFRTTGLTYGQLRGEFVALHHAIEDDVETERFYHYPRDKGFLNVRVPGDWAAALRAFPSARADIEAAVDCYALGHPNASIHHSMMVLEFGLAALAKPLGVKIRANKSTWAPLVSDIRDAIDHELDGLAKPPPGTRPLKPAAARKKRAFLETCQEAALDLRHFKNVWRDHISHGRGDYNEKDARKALDHVQSFMEIISTKMKLKETKLT